MKKYQVYEMPLLKNSTETAKSAKDRVEKDKESPRIVILRGGLGESDPKAFMDAVVSEYVQNLGYNEFIEEFLDNPWVRVLIFGINDVEYKEVKNG